MLCMAIEPIRDVRRNLDDVVARVCEHGERVTVTKDDTPVAVIINPEELASLEETVDVLSDPQALLDIREAKASLAHNDVARGADDVRALLD